jgi:hypothetical protein
MFLLPTRRPIANPINRYPPRAQVLVVVVVVVVTMKSYLGVIGSLSVVVSSLPGIEAKHLRDQKRLPSLCADASFRNIVGRKTTILDGADVAEKSIVVQGGASHLDSGFLHRLKIGFYFAAWYALSIVYNSKSVRYCMNQVL